uniref:Lipoprotein n=1 Tax=Mycoplasma feriruminatoris TaxID=1179777 RepID=A0A654IBD3_9MOLU|nr:hypothetical protein MF5292_00911 [Mycoplasma feriruminatoris]VZR75873.1 hypothetical protein MF5294_00907 [Mycoplasma feriruminatoris]VZR98684.1 hypothetical protein MF5293_00905 [Mycoplasma feriruminatoris]
MKKLLTMLGSIALIATTSAAVVACGGKNPSQSSEKQPSENSNTPTDESKKDDEKGKDETKPDFSKVEKQVIGNFPPNDKKTVPQSDIKKKLADILKVQPSELTDLDVNYETNSGKVTLPKFNKTLEFKFTTMYELGEFELKNGAVPQLEIKKKIADILKVQPSELTDLNVNYETNTGTVKTKKDSSKFIEFKFSIKKMNNN